MKILLAIILGSFFGYALYKVEALNPKKLLGMLRLEDLHLAKVILFAIGLGSVLLYLANLLNIFDIDHLSVKTLNTGVIIGGAIFGLGFGGIGSCPGTCVGGVGSENMKKSLATVVGALVGAFVFSITYSGLVDLGFINNFDMGKVTLFNVSSEYEYLFNLGFEGILITGIIFMIGAMLLPSSILKKK